MHYVKMVNPLFYVVDERQHNEYQCVFLKLNFYIGQYIIVCYKEVIKCFRIPTYFNDNEKSLRRVPKIAAKRYKRKNSKNFFSGIHSI